MDRSKKKDDKQSLYEIYRACRLCGAGGGYKMPIIQNFLQIDGEEIDLKQKIRECLQLEVNIDDQMPPLICELCVDKVNDFYEFLNVCKRTNTQTRKRLGLPLKVASKDSATETCLLGLVEASSLKVEPEEPPSKKANKMKINKEIEQIKQEPIKNTPKDMSIREKLKPKDTKIPLEKSKDKSLKDIKMEKENKMDKEVKETIPKRTTRNNSLEDLVFTKIQDFPKKASPRAGPKSMVRKSKDQVDNTEEKPSTKLKRLRDKEIKESLPPTKKNKPDPKTEKITPAKPDKTTSPIAKPTSKPAVSKKVQPVQKMEKFKCPVCSTCFKTTQSLSNHMIHCHPITWTSDSLACNACQEWFPTIEESVAHHKNHTHYKCLKCKKKYKNGVSYHQHTANNKCLPEIEVPDVKCIACWRFFATKHLFKEHRCLGPDGRPGGKCKKCNRNYTLLKNLRKHESTCTFLPSLSKTVEPVIDPEVRNSLLPMEVRVTKCDDLLEYGPVVSACTVPHRYGLDSRRSYPYMPKLRVIKQPLFQPTPEHNSTEFDTADLEWEDFLSLRTENTVKKLSTLCLKEIFSEKILGNKLVLDNEDYQKRLNLKRKIDSIIFKFEDSNSCDSNSILDKNTVASFDNLMNKVTNQNSDTTIVDEIASGFRSHDDASSGNVVYDDHQPSKNNDPGSKDTNDDETDSQNDHSESRNDDFSSKETDLINHDDKDCQNDDLGSKEKLGSNNDETESQNDHLGSKNDGFNSKDLNCKDSDNEKHLEVVNNQTDTSSLNKFNSEVNSNNNKCVKTNEDIVKNDGSQNTAIGNENDENKDQHDNIVSETDTENSSTNIDNQTEVKLDENNIKLDPNTRIDIDQNKEDVDKADLKPTENRITVNSVIGETKNDESENCNLNLTKNLGTNDTEEKLNLSSNDTAIDDVLQNINNSEISATNIYVQNKESRASSKAINNFDKNDINLVNTDIVQNTEDVDKADVNLAENKITVNSEIDETKNYEPSNSNLIFTKNSCTNDTESKLNLPLNDTVVDDVSKNIHTNKTKDSINNSEISDTNSYVPNKESSTSTNVINNVDNNEINSLKIKQKTESISKENYNNSNSSDIDDNIKVNTSNSMTEMHNILTKTDSVGNHGNSNTHCNNIEANKSEDLKESKTIEINETKLKAVDENSIQNKGSENSLTTSLNHEKEKLKSEIGNKFNEIDANDSQLNIKIDMADEYHSQNEKNGADDSRNVNDECKIFNNDLSNDNDVLNSSNYNANNQDITNKNNKTPENSVKNSDFSISGILNNDNTNENHNQIDNISKSVESAQINNANDKINDKLKIENDNTNSTAEKSHENDKNNFPDNISLNEATDDSCSTKENDSKIDRNDDSLSLKSLKFIDNSIEINKDDKYNVNDLNEEEKRLMAELDEQIGENNDKTDFDALSENYDFNV